MERLIAHGFIVLARLKWLPKRVRLWGVVQHSLYSKIQDPIDAAECTMESWLTISGEFPRSRGFTVEEGTILLQRILALHGVKIHPKLLPYIIIEDYRAGPAAIAFEREIVFYGIQSFTKGVLIHEAVHCVRLYKQNVGAVSSREHPHGVEFRRILYSTLINLGLGGGNLEEIAEARFAKLYELFEKRAGSSRRS